MFDDIVLEQEQIELLFSLIESLASVPREKRIKFGGTQKPDGTSIIFHGALPGHNISALLGDIEALDHAGLVNLTNLGTGSFKFDVTPMGRKYYEIQRGKFGSPAERIEKQVKTYIEAENFRNTFPLAFEKWSTADSRLWASESLSELSVIGHLCREAMQEFVNVLVDKYQPVNVDTNKAHDIARLKSVLKHCSNTIPSTLLPFLESLISYWGTLNDLIQRQEHAGQKEGSTVDWEDARRVVFHTAVVFLEIDRTLSSTA